MVELLYAVSTAFFVFITDYKLLNLLILTPTILSFKKSMHAMTYLLSLNTGG